MNFIYLDGTGAVFKSVESDVVGRQVVNFVLLPLNPGLKQRPTVRGHDPTKYVITAVGVEVSGEGSTHRITHAPSCTLGGETLGPPPPPGAHPRLVFCYR